MQDYQGFHPLTHVFLLDYYDNRILLLFIVAYKVNEVSQDGWNRRFDRIPPTTDEHREYNRSTVGASCCFR
jgi:hypothetical protein